MVNIDLSIDYMTSPIQLLESVLVSLKPGGHLVATFSNRMFHTKAVRMWLPLNCRQRQKIVAAYMHYAGYGRIRVYELPPTPGHGPQGVDLHRSGGQEGDPLNIVVGTKLTDVVQNKDEL